MRTWRLILLICLLCATHCLAGQIQPGRGARVNTSHFLSRNVVGYWPLNEGTGTTVFDLSGNNNTGTITGAIWEPGKFGFAVSFDGTDDYIDISDDPVFDLTDITISIWLRRDAATISHLTPMSKWQTSGNNREWALTLIKSGGNFYPQVAYSKDGTAESTLAASTYFLTPDAWYHYVVTYKYIADGTSVLKIYMNGVEIATTSSAAGPLSLKAASIQIGAQHVTSYEHEGLLDNVALFNRDLTPSEIVQLYREPFGMFDVGRGSWAGTATGPAVVPKTQTIIIGAMPKIFILMLMILIVHYCLPNRIKANFVIILCLLTVPTFAQIGSVETGHTGKSVWTEWSMLWMEGTTIFGEIPIGDPGQYLCVNRDWGNRGYFWDTLTTDDIPEGTEADRKYCTLAQIRDLLNTDFHNIGGKDDDQPDSDSEVPDEITLNSYERITGTNEGEQLRLAYDETYYASFTVDSSGDLTIGVTGDYSIILEDALDGGSENFSNVGEIECEEIRSIDSLYCRVDISPAVDEIAITPGHTNGDRYVVFKSVDNTDSEPQIYPNVDGNGRIGIAGNRWKEFLASGSITGGTLTDGTFSVNAGTMSGIADLGTVTTADIDAGTWQGTIDGAWTAAGQTCADLGTVTTADIDGGTIDGTTIGGGTPAGGTFTNLTANDNVVLGSANTDSITCTGDFVSTLRPNATDTYNLGNLDHRWDEGHFKTATINTLALATGSITDTGGTISFGNENLTTTGTATSKELILTTATQDYLFTNRASSTPLALQSQTSATGFEFDMYTKDGDATDNIQFVIFGKGTPTSGTNTEQFKFQWRTATNQYRLLSTKTGTGTGRAFTAETTGNTNQLKLGTGGEVYMAQAVDDALSNLRAAYWDSATGQIGYDSSGRIYKENIIDLPDANSEKIYNLRPRMYDRINGTAKDEIGLIAEEVAAVYPQYISYRYDEIMDTRIDDDGEEEVYVKERRKTDVPESVNYSKLIVPLLKEVQKLKARVDSLEAEVEELKRGQ